MNSTLRTTVIAIFLVAFVSPLLGQTQRGRNASVILKARAKEVYSGRVDSVTVNLYSGNDLIRSEFEKMGRFSLELPLNQSLYIELIRENYYPKRIKVNTQLPADLQKTYYLSFDLFMIHEVHAKGVDDFILDFPTGLIEFDQKAMKFTYAEKYTKKIFKEISKLLLIAERRANSESETEALQ